MYDIAGAIKQPETPFQLQGGLNQILQQRQALQEGGLALQQKQQDLADQQAMTAAMHEWDGKDMNALPGLVIKHGASAKAVMGLKSGILEQQQKFATIAKDGSEADKNNLASQGMRNDQVAGALQSVIDTPDEQFGPALMTTAQGLAQKGLIDPQHLQVAQHLATMPPADAKQALSLFKKGYQSESQQIKSAMDSADIALKTAQQGEAAAKGEQTGRANAASQLAGAQDQMSYAQVWKQLPVNVARSFPNPGQWSAAPEFKDSLMKAGMTPDQQATLPVEKVEMNSWLKQNPGKSPADFMKYKASIVPALNFNLQNAGATGTGGQPSSIAQAIASGQMKWGDAVSARTPMTIKQSLLREVQAINPNFNSGDFAVEQGVKKYFAYGKGADQAQAFNTTLAHFGTLNAAVDALDNGNVQALNKVSNAFKAQFGGTAPTNFAVVKQIAADEFAKAAAGANVAQSDREKSDSLFSSAQSPKQLKQAISTGVELLQGKMRSLEYTRSRAGNPNASLMSPEAQAGVNSIQGTPSGISNIHVNPQTGAKIGWNGQAWVAVQ